MDVPGASQGCLGSPRVLECVGGLFVLGTRFPGTLWDFKPNGVRVPEGSREPGSRSFWGNLKILLAFEEGA